MSAPKRWLEDDGGATRGERALLRGGLADDPPPDAKAAVWASILTQIPPLPPLPGAAGSASGSSVGGAKAAVAAKATGSAATAAVVGGGLLKSALVGAGSAVALLVTYTAVAPSQPVSEPAPLATAAASSASAASMAAPPRAPARAPGVVQPIATPLDDAPKAPGLPALPDPPGAAPPADPVDSHAAPPGAGEPSKGRGIAPIAAGNAGPTAMDPETRLLEESRRLAEARDALRRGDAAGALGRLDELRRAVPGGILGQEREALAIEALARSGRAADAQARARAFLQAYPQSPHATRVETFAR